MPTRAASVVDLIELARTEYLVWREESQRARHQRLEKVQSQHPRIQARAHERCTIYRDTLSQDIRERLAIFQRISAKHECPEMLVPSRLNELRAEIERHTRAAIASLRDQNRRDLHESGDSPMPFDLANGLPDPPGYDDRWYERLCDGIVGTADATLEHLKIAGREPKALRPGPKQDRKRHGDIVRALKHAPGWEKDLRLAVQALESAQIDPPKPRERGHSSHQSWGAYLKANRRSFLNTLRYSIRVSGVT